MKVNLNVYKSTGEQHQLQRYEIYEGQDVIIPDGSYILYCSVIGEGGVEFLEVWASVPKSSILSTKRIEESASNPAVPKQMTVEEAIKSTNWND